MKKKKKQNQIRINLAIKCAAVMTKTNQFHFVGIHGDRACAGADLLN